MTDLEITRLCAQAMGFSVTGLCDYPLPETMLYISEAIFGDDRKKSFTYDPLHDDAQAMALVKKFRLYIDASFYEMKDCDQANTWHVTAEPDEIHDCGIDTDLNRAICECVAKMQKAKA